MQQPLVLVEAPCWDGQPLPRWAYKVPDLELWHAADREDALHVSSFSAWRPLLQANMTLWPFALAVPIVVYFMSECQGEGLATAPSWLWAFYLPPLGFSLFCDFAAHRELVWVHVGVLGAFTVQGQVVAFTLWFVLVLCLAALSHADLFTSGLFLGRLAATYACEESRVPAIWRSVVEHSLLRVMPGLDCLGVLFWALLFVQPLVAAYHGVPRNPAALRQQYAGERSGEVELVMDSLRGAGTGVFGSASLETLAGHVSSSDQASALADSARSVLVGFREAALARALLPEAARQYPVARRAVSFRIQRLACKTVTNFFLEASFQPSLQATALAVQVAATRGAVDKMTLLSLCFSFAMGAYNFVQARSLMLSLARMVEPDSEPGGAGRGEDADEDDLDLQLVDDLQVAEPAGDGEQAVQPAQEPWAQPADFQAKLDEETQARVKRSMRIFYAAVVFWGVMTAYSAAKTIAAVGACPDGVWNLSGCVDVHGAR